MAETGGFIGNTHPFLVVNSSGIREYQMRRPAKKHTGAEATAWAEALFDTPKRSSKRPSPVSTHVRTPNEVENVDSGSA
jgi:hypothetical protein